MNEEHHESTLEVHEFRARPWSYGLELLIHGILVVASVLIMVVGMPGTDLPGILGSIIPRLGGALGTLVFGYAALNVVRLLRDPRPALRISPEGILNRTYWSSTTLVPWEEILEIKKSRVPAAFEVVLRDPAAFRRRQTLAPRTVMRLSSLLGRPSFLLFLPQLRGSRTEVYDHLVAAQAAVELEAVRKQRLLGSPDDQAPSA